MRFNASKYNQHWQDKKLSELGSFQRGKSRHRPRNDNSLFENGTHPLVQTGEIKDANLYIYKHSAAYNDIGVRAYHNLNTEQKGPTKPDIELFFGLLSQPVNSTLIPRCESASYQGTLQLGDLATGLCHRILEGHQG